MVGEDQTLTAISIETYLEEAGFAVQTVASMAEVWVRLEANTADVAIVDFILKDGPATELAGEFNSPTILFPHLFWLSSAPEHALRVSGSAMARKAPEP